MADDYIVQHQDLQPESYLTMVRGMYMRMGFGPLSDPTEDNTVGQVAARINHGRWLVDCGGCNSALVVDLSQPVFMCVECGNATNEGKWFTVTVPTNRKAIEAELLKRPWSGRNPAEAVNRNWSPGETVATLKQENTDHGI
jgi:ribosomal protein L37AE/L43A